MAQKVLSKVEIFILIVIAIIFLSFTMQKCGIDVAATSDESEIIDHPHE